MSDFEARLRRELTELGRGYTPEPELASRIIRRTRQRARRRQVSAVSAFVVAMVAVFGTVAGMELTSPSPHSRVDGAVANTTSPDGSAGGAGRSGSGNHHKGGHKGSRKPTDGAAGSGDTTTSAGTQTTGGTASGTGGSVATDTTPPSTAAGGGKPSSSATTDTSIEGTSPSSSAPTTDTLPPTTDTLPPTTDTTQAPPAPLPPPPPAPPQVVITGPPCPAIGAATYTATVDGPATLTWSNGDTGPTATYSFLSAGMLTISVTAQDASGQSSSASYPVTVGATC